MTVGDGIFAGAVVIALIALFIATKDRWNWRKIFLWPLLVLVALAFTIGLGLWAWDVYDSRPKVQTDFGNIALGETINSVHFKKGTPNPKDTKTDEEENPIYRYASDDDTVVEVRFKDGKVRAVYGWSTRAYGLGIQRIYFGSSAERIIETFGRGAEVEESKDGTGRIYAFPRYQVFFFLSQNKVKLMGIYNSAYPVPIQAVSRDEK